MVETPMPAVGVTGEVTVTVTSFDHAGLGLTQPDVVVTRHWILSPVTSAVAGAYT